MGDGSLKDYAWPVGVTYLGQQSSEQVVQSMKAATVLIFPSVWYECAPMTIIEALACGLSVIGSNLGSISEFINDHRTGLLFNPGDADDLAAKVRWAFDHPEQINAMRVEARREYERKYTPEQNYRMLMAIYESAIEHSRRRQRAAS